MLSYPSSLIYYYRLSMPPNKAIAILGYTVDWLGRWDNNDIHFA
jgi:hypothetical protein